MFGREPRQADHKQHLVPSAPTGYGFQRAEDQILSASQKVAKEDGERKLVRAARHETSERVAAHHLAFFDGIDIPEARHRVAGWDWDDHLNGFLAAEAAREFTCACGANVPAPGYTDCSCGKRWNVYSVQSPQGKKLISREVPVRENVVMASHAVEEGVSLPYDRMASDTESSELRDHPRREGSLGGSDYREGGREDLQAQGSGAETGDLWSNLTTAGVHGRVAGSRLQEDDSLPSDGDLRRSRRGSSRSASQRGPDGQSAGELGLRRDRHSEHEGYGRARSAMATEEDSLPRGSSAGAPQSRAFSTGARLEKLRDLQEGYGSSSVQEGVTISANGSKKMIAREVPVRDGVVMASRTAAYKEDDGYTSPEPGDSVEIYSNGSYFDVQYDQKLGDHKFRATDGQSVYVDSIVSINGDPVDPEFFRLESSRKTASPDLAEALTEIFEPAGWQPITSERLDWMKGDFEFYGLIGEFKDWNFEDSGGETVYTFTEDQAVQYAQKALDYVADKGGGSSYW